MAAGSGSGPGTPPPLDQGVCAISPSDLVGYVGNIINRVKELEQKVAELEAKNTEVDQLSDLSQQVGWVGGITYMGTEGWTQTEYGSLIPPLGWTLADAGLLPPSLGGSGLQMVYTDADGNISTASAGGQTLVLSTSAQLLGFGEAIDWEDELFSNSTAMSWSGDTITLPSPGTYAISLQLISASWGTPPITTQNLNMRVNTQIDSTNIVFMSFTDGGTGTPFDNVCTAVVHKSLGDTTSCKIEMRNSGADITAAFTLVIAQLSSA